MLKVETQKSHRFEDLCSLQYGWDFTVSQLGPSQGESTARLYRTPHVGYNRFFYATAYDQRLYSRQGFLSFGLFEPGNPATWTYDQLIPNDAITVFPQGEELKGASPVGFHGNGLHFRVEFMTNLGEQVYQRPLESLVPAPGIYLPDPAKLTLLRLELHKWQRLEAFSAQIRPGIISRREESLALAVIDALSNEFAIEENSPKISEVSMTRALEFIHSNELENISAVELCQQARCSQRTLEKGFLKRFGVTPKKYIKCLRLAQVYQGLRDFDGQGCNSVIEIAGVHGFWHMGQFAADYRRFYGELPSETMKRR